MAKRKARRTAAAPKIARRKAAPHPVDEVRFRVSVSEPDPMLRNSSREPVTDYAWAVAKLERFVARMTAALAAAREPFSRGAARLLESAGSLAEEFGQSDASSVLWDAGRAIRVDEACRRGADPRVDKYKQERAHEQLRRDEENTPEHRRFIAGHSIDFWISMMKEDAAATLTSEERVAAVEKVAAKLEVAVAVVRS